jgi:hypothetical protein
MEVEHDNEKKSDAVTAILFAIKQTTINRVYTKYIMFS